MSGVNLPHDHGQNIEKVLERMPDSEECVLVAEVFKQISDGSRIRILWLLCHCEECVSNIAAAMQMSDPAVSHHLKLLKKSGLIVSRRDGKEIYYRLADTQTAQLFTSHNRRNVQDHMSSWIKNDIKKKVQYRLLHLFYFGKA